MEKTNLCILLFVVLLTSLCNSNDYNYDDYKYNEYNYDDENYDYYHNKKSEDYTEELNDYYGHQNLLAPAPFPIAPLFNSPSPPPSLPQPGNYIFVC